MSILRRLVNLGRSELNSLLERAANVDDDEVMGRDKSGWHGLDNLSDDELIAELERRKRDKDAATRGETVEPEERRSRPRTGTASAGAGAGTRTRRPSEGTRQRTRTPVGSRAPIDQVARAYAALEIPNGSSWEAVRKAYRSLMRKYHPDHHTGSPEKQKAANEVAQKLTESYKLLEKRLRK